MAYANRAASSAAPRKNPEPAGSGFARDVAQLARGLRLSVLDLTDAERHLLKDVAEQRYPMKTLVTVMSICSRSYRPEQREALAELVRRECLRNAEVPHDVAAAFDLETQATAEAELPQREYERRRCPASKRFVLDRLLRQLHFTRAAIDVVHADQI